MQTLIRILTHAIACLLLLFSGAAYAQLDSRMVERYDAPLSDSEYVYFEDDFACATVNPLLRATGINLGYLDLNLPVGHTWETTTPGLRLRNLTTTQAEAISALQDGDLWYDETTEGLMFVSDDEDAGLLQTPGALGVFYSIITGSVSDGDTIVTTDGGTNYVYEFDTNSSVSGSNVAVDVSGDQTADAAATAFVTAINAHSSRVYDCGIDGANNDARSTFFCIELPPGTEGPLTVADTATNITLSAASAVGSAKPEPTRKFSGSYTVTSGDVAQMGSASGADGVIIGGFDGGSTSRVESFYVTTSSGLTKATANITTIIAQPNSGGPRLLLVANGSGLLADGDIISWTVSE